MADETSARAQAERAEIEREVKRQLAGIPDAAELVKEGLSFAGMQKSEAAAICLAAAALVEALGRQTAAIEDLAKAVSRQRPLRNLLSRPYAGAWTDEVLVEAAHQVARWGAEHDAGKTPADWFWLVGYLAGKALHAAHGGEMSKAHHHTVSTAAVLLNWAAQISGRERVMRPGLGPEKLAALSSPGSSDE